jgi:hypothetical protein
VAFAFDDVLRRLDNSAMEQKLPSGGRYQELIALTTRRIALAADPVTRAELERALSDLQAMEAKADKLDVKLAELREMEAMSKRHGITSVGWLFRANASPREKAFTLFALGWMVLSIYGMTNSFVSEPFVREMAAYGALPLSLLFFMPVFLDRHPSNKVLTYGRFKRWSLYLVLLAFTYGLSWVGLAMGTASLATRIFGTEFAGEFRVVSRSDGSRKRRECDYSFRLEDVRSQWKTKFCVEEEFWAAVKNGDVLLGQGIRSSLGTMLLSLQKPGT